MSDDQDHRRSIRLRGFDYAGRGAYFVTIVADRRRCLFGKLVDGRMLASRLGDIAVEEWQAGPSHRPVLELGSYCLMPNHLHAIVWIVEPAVRKEGDPRIALRIKALGVEQLAL
jgi:putative transposase